MAGEVWILGATGRVGRAAAARLADRGVDLVLVGRDRDSLQKVVPGQSKVIVANGVEQMTADIARERPAVVVNLLGRYGETAVPIARACMPGGHYVDLANDLAAFSQVFALHREAIDAGSTLITGAGFGVLATEALVIKLCEDRPTPERVRVDALASVATDAGVLGAALGATIVDVLVTGGRGYQDGRMVRARLGSGVRIHPLPDGQQVKSGVVPTGELLAAQRASGAPNVSATSALAPTSPVVRAVLPLFAVLLSIPGLRRLAVRRLAGVRVKAAPRPRTHSWGHAVITWPDGSTRKGWLRTDDAMDYTADVITETATRLGRGEGPAGVYTPAAAFGPDLAIAANGTFLLDQ
ncbi:short subunit dehydrogenase-like uncharacterized protein [Kribbella voronezhensis]|uniref:Short subunit dehydrogenase-like uncharacterized protein n=1 Tax=Kribbella voronezhensis TaxID=2512212 RepID=A0A4R7THV8_9ACTN|nr:saccharopine dehydrogenase NADP-binding domain-containing protein [Kribbella voronezhensis]TDU91932.1 short subunit dehydrogenase-like uncharacterized protein [Kribbella voronezhensis]